MFNIYKALPPHRISNDKHPHSPYKISPGKAMLIFSIAFHIHPHLNPHHSLVYLSPNPVSCAFLFSFTFRSFTSFAWTCTRYTAGSPILSISQCWSPAFPLRGFVGLIPGRQTPPSVFLSFPCPVCLPVNYLLPLYICWTVFPRPLPSLGRSLSSVYRL